MSGSAPAADPAGADEGAYLWRFEGAVGLDELVAAEAAALGGAPVAGFAGVHRFPDPGGPRRAAYGLGGGRVLGAGPPGGPLPLPPGAREVHVLRGRWKQPGHPLDHLAQLGWKVRNGPPGCPLQLWVSPGRWLLVEAAPDGGFVEPELPLRNSTSLPSRLARAVVNLVALPGERLVDPVCGTGVLLVEAARIGCRARGTDLSRKASWSALRNLAAVSLPGEVVRADALAPPADEPRFDALVGDLPYGRRLVAQELTPFARALPPRARRWAIVSALDLRPALIAAGHPPRYTVRARKPTFCRFVHVGGEPLARVGRG